MKLIFERVMKLLEFGGSYAITNLLLTFSYFLFVSKNDVEQLITLTVLLNVLWITGFIFFFQNSSTEKKTLSVQFILFCAGYLLTYLKIVSPHNFINSIIAINMFFLAVYCLINKRGIAFIKDNLKKQLTPALHQPLVVKKLSPQYQQNINYHTNNVEVAFTQQNIKGNTAELNKSYEQDIHLELEDAEYQLREIRVGDTLASWAITIPYRPLQHNIIPAREIRNRILKRSIDIIISLFVIIFILSWLIPIIGVLIKLESKGAIIFRQLRSGINNQPFWCYKFRSMYQNEACDEQQATRGDKRITKIGAFLRKTSIDELPQFINVFKGEMSIVGPRPHMLKHTEEYGHKVNNYMTRLSIKQGLTGWAQINGYRGETSDVNLMEQRVKHDLWYMKNWSIWLDIKIIYLTIVQIFQNKDHVF